MKFVLSIAALVVLLATLVLYDRITPTPPAEVSDKPLTVEEAEAAKEEGREPYPHLNSFTDGKPATCDLKPEEAAWLTEQMDKGNIRLATPEDIKAWEDLAKKKGRPIHEIMLNCGRTYTILKSMVVDPISNNQTSFIVPAGVPFPQVKTGNTVYDLNRGGWYQLGSFDDGEKRNYGSYPDDPINKKLEEESGKHSLDLIKKAIAK